MNLLSKRGAEVDYYDPYVPAIKSTGEHAHWAGKKSVKCIGRPLRDLILCLSPQITAA